MASGDSKKTVRERYYLSESGVISLQDKLIELEKSRAEHIERLKILKEQQSDGVSLEDSSYIQALSSMQYIETETDKIRYILSNAAVIKGQLGDIDQVGIGSHVRLQGDNGQFEYTIVNSIEADPFNGKISDESPLGQQLLGKKLEEIVSIGSKKQQLLKLVSIS